MTIIGRDVFSGEAVELSVGGDRIEKRRRIPGTRDMMWLSPGWIDLQVNGWMGVDYNGESLDMTSLVSLCSGLASHGTTRHLATVITASQDDICRRLETVRRFREESPWIARRICGFHVEGPYLSEQDGYRGAHDARWIRNPSLDEYEEWQASSGGLVKIVTLAPERPGALDFIRAVSSRGTVVSLGHTAADPGLIAEAVDAGARMSTHLGNGMAGVISRHGNPIWAQLSNDALSVSLIADSHHLPQEFLKTAYRAKLPGSLVLVSDAAPPGGTAPGRRSWAGIDVEVEESGRIGLAGTDYLAGAGHLLDRCVGHFAAATGCGIGAAVSACTVTPSSLIGLPEKDIALEEGSPADIVAFRFPLGGGSVEISGVVVDGKEIDLRL